MTYDSPKVTSRDVPVVGEPKLYVFQILHTVVQLKNIKKNKNLYVNRGRAIGCLFSISFNKIKW